MKIKELSALLFHAAVKGDEEAEVHGIEMDSRKVQSGDLFVCVRGERFDGHHYAKEAVEKGASALLVQEVLDIAVPQIVYADTRYAMAVFAAHYYGYPSSSMKLIGITGTNGKTTTSMILEQLLASQGKQTGLMGTIQIKIGDEIREVSNTTQEACVLQKSFRQMVERGAEYCVMEVSSHALHFGRVLGCDFRTAIFTNLTQDHLDFHHTMDRYLQTKSLLFSRLGNTFNNEPFGRKYAVINEDDPASEYMKQVTAAQVITYGLQPDADVRADQIRLTAGGTTFHLTTFAGEAEVKMKLIGKFNVYNTLAAITAALIEGMSLKQIVNALETVSPVEGRMELVEEGQPYLVVVDYAHTPDGLENVLQTVSEFAEGKIYCVFGCGGDRDRGKRPQMGRLAAELSDVTIVTSDNPRNEDPKAIIEEIVAGIKQSGAKEEHYLQIEDRRRAIQQAVEMASPGDVVLIMGKGHETYQEVKGVRTYFDDREVAKQAIRSILH